MFTSRLPKQPFRNFEMAVLVLENCGDRLLKEVTLLLHNDSQRYCEWVALYLDIKVVTIFPLFILTLPLFYN